MYGYICSKDDRKIIYRVDNVVETGSDYIKGTERGYKGINVDCCFIFVCETCFEEGSLLPIEEINQSSQTKSKDQIISELQQQVADLTQTIAQMQLDLLGV